MIHFNELYVTEDGKNLVIDAEIDDIAAFDQCVIDSISVNIGKNCASPARDAVTVYDKPSYVVGDLDNDGRVLERDIKLWMTLDDLWKYELKQDDNGYYYKKYVENSEGDNVLEPFYVSQDVVDLMHNISVKYKSVAAVINRTSVDTTLTTTTANGFSGSCMIAYIVNQLGGRTLTGTVPKFFGDIDGDGAIGVADLSAFYTYLDNLKKNTTTPITTSNGSRHVRLCLDAADLAPLVEDKDLSEHLFIVNVHAAVLGGYTEIAKIECGFICTDPSISGVAYNGKPLYDSAVQHANACGNTCATNDMSQFVDWLLRYYGFIFALKAGDLCTAQRYWSEYLRGGAPSGFRSSNPCGCHGVYR